MYAIAKFEWVVPGLDQAVVNAIDWTRAIGNVVADSRSDFILSPHFDAIFQRNSATLIAQTTEQLRNGRYNPRLPLTMSVPKGPFLTRPGSILEPADRLVYQALVEAALPQLEAQMDRRRTFSHVPSTEAGELFRSNHESWDAFQASVGQICEQSAYVLRTDIANYFETIPQHPVVNLMTASGVRSEIVRLLEEQLLAFRQRASFGIVQGLFPSDVLGNFYLTDFDGNCSLQELPSARYVDDIYVGFDSELAARRALIRIIERLRQNGLSLNDRKTSIQESGRIIQEEGEVDRLFAEAREEIENEVEFLRMSGYGFQGDWINEDDPQVVQREVDLGATRALLRYTIEASEQAEKIERFCLPILRGADDDSAVEYVLGALFQRPQLTRIYSSYLTQFSRQNADIVARIEELLHDDAFFSDYQRMYVLASVLNCERVGERAVRKAMQWMTSQEVSPETRAISALFVAKFGNAAAKRAVRLQYENEASEYVRSAILFSAQYFPNAEKRAAKQAWSGHSTINALIAETI